MKAVSHRAVLAHEEVLDPPILQRGVCEIPEELLLALPRDLLVLADHDMATLRV